MATKIKDTGKTQPRLGVRSKTEKRVAPEVVSKALGASAAEAERVEETGNPFMFYAIRNEIIQRLESSGGRPKLRNTTHRPKIPLDERDWLRLKEIVALLRKQNVTTTPGQVASVLLHRSLEQTDLATIKENLTEDCDTYD